MERLVFFLLWAEVQDPKMMFGGHRVGEAVDALEDLMRAPRGSLRELIK